MAIRDPFAAYNADSNIEAHLVCGLLRDAGIEAMVIEDVSYVGMTWAGTAAEIHKPQVWIERADVERARPVLSDYDRRAADRRAAERGERQAGPPVAVVCEECGKRSEFPAAQRGTTQSCPHCRADVDVGDDAGVEGWDESPGDEAWHRTRRGRPDREVGRKRGRRQSHEHAFDARRRGGYARPRASIT